MSASSSAITMLTLCLVVGCVDQHPRWTGTMYDSAGVTIVSNTDVGIWAPGEEWTLQEELRIGAVEGDKEYEFGVIASGGIAVDAQERIFVLDAQAQEIRVFSDRGEYLQTIGGPGGGPGEFAGAGAVLMGPGDTLFVPDQRNRRMNRFAPDGSFVGSSEFSLEDGLSVAFGTNDAGVIAEQVSPWAFDRPRPDNPRDLLVTWASHGTRSDTLAHFPAGQTWFQEEGGAVHTTWYASEPCWAVTKDMKVLLGRNDDYRIEVFSAGQRLDRVVIKAHEPQPVLAQDVNRVKSHMENRWRQMGAPPAQITQLWNQQHFNEFFPAFRAFVEGPAGTIWVQKMKPPSEVPEDEILWFHWPRDWVARDWDVFDYRGRFLGVVEMPPRFQPMQFLSDRIYGIWWGDLNVQHVVRLRVKGMPDTRDAP